MPQASRRDGISEVLGWARHTSRPLWFGHSCPTLAKNRVQTDLLALDVLRGRGPRPAPSKPQGQRSPLTREKESFRVSSELFTPQDASLLSAQSCCNGNVHRHGVRILKESLRGLHSPFCLSWQFFPNRRKWQGRVTIATNLIGGLQVFLQPEGGAHVLKHEARQAAKKPGFQGPRTAEHP